MALHQNEVQRSEESNKGKGKENRKQRETNCGQNDCNLVVLTHFVLSINTLFRFLTTSKSTLSYCKCFTLNHLGPEFRNSLELAGRNILYVYLYDVTQTHTQ